MGLTASINFKPVKTNSEVHNTRDAKLDYNFPELEVNNENLFIVDGEYSEVNTQSVPQAEKECRDYCKEESGRKMMKNAAPVREAVINLTADSTKEQILSLSKRLKSEFGIDCFQVHIHRDEGQSRGDLNHHAHLLFKWVDRRKEVIDKKTGELVKNTNHGKILRFNRYHFSKIQTITSEELGMERGELRVNSNTERLEATEYKTQQEQLKLESLQDKTEVLEQKKNKLEGKLRIVRAEDPTRDRIQRETEEIIRIIGVEEIRKEHISKFLPESINRAIELQQKTLNIQSSDIDEEQRIQQRSFRVYQELTGKA